MPSWNGLVNATADAIGQGAHPPFDFWPLVIVMAAICLSIAFMAGGESDG